MKKQRLFPSFMAVLYGVCTLLWLCIWLFRGGGAAALFCGGICLLAAAWLLRTVREKQERPQYKTHSN